MQMSADPLPASLCAWFGANAGCCHKRSRGAVGATVPTSDDVYERASDGVSEASVGNGPGDGLSDGTHVPLEVGAKVGVWP